MKPTDTLAFIYPWRDYQARILAELDRHLGDEKLHVVAAPGSGKTVVGLEVFRRLAKPALILAPTLAIRNQWIARLIELFGVERETAADWISKDVRHPKFLTVSTYQGLFSALSDRKKKCADEEEDEDSDDGTGIPDPDPLEIMPPAEVIAGFKQAGLGVLILDEAHHLRREWWKTLTRLTAGIKPLQLVSLTATPPYDVDPSEWRRYEALCGPIDCEVSVPELVRTGDLCPHQDYVHFSLLNEHETEMLVRFRTGIARMASDLTQDEVLLDAIEAHPWLRQSDKHLVAILDQPEIFASFLVLLHAAGRSPDPDALALLGVRGETVPLFDTRWMETLINAVIYQHDSEFDAISGHRDKIRKALSRHGAIDRRKVRLVDSKLAAKLLAGSLNKLDSIRDICRMEAETCGETLRLVVLTDYIRREEIPTRTGDERLPARMGVGSIFETLRRTDISGLRLGVLTGSLVIIPKSARAALLSCAEAMGLPAASLSFGPMKHDQGYLQVSASGSARKRIVELITEVFRQGHVNALVGTQALLGEGWDSPALNTLILASQVGSFMLSNQMRGRAIRVDPADPDKVANVWHLACADPASSRKPFGFLETALSATEARIDAMDQIQKDLGQDVRSLRRRFRGFEGITHTDPALIESGMSRLGLADVSWTAKGIDNLNAATLIRASERSRVRRRWQGALQGDAAFNQQRLETEYAPPPVITPTTLKHLLWTAGVIASYLALNVLARIEDGTSIWYALLAAMIAGLSGSAFHLCKAAWLWLRNGSVEGSIRSIGHVVLEVGAIETPRARVTVVAQELHDGRISCKVVGLSNPEQKLFYDALEEVLNPIENPRYLIRRRSALGPLGRVDYHPVPTLLGKRRQDAEAFAEAWRDRVSDAELIYTRTGLGRLDLLKARTRAFSSAPGSRSGRRSAWE